MDFGLDIGLLLQLPMDIEVQTLGDGGDKVRVTFGDIIKGKKVRVLLAAFVTVVNTLYTRSYLASALRSRLFHFPLVTPRAAAKFGKLLKLQPKQQQSLIRLVTHAAGRHCWSPRSIHTCVQLQPHPRICSEGQRV